MSNRSAYITEFVDNVNNASARDQRALKTAARNMELTAAAKAVLLRMIPAPLFKDEDMPVFLAVGGMLTNQPEGRPIVPLPKGAGMQLIINEDDETVRRLFMHMMDAEDREIALAHMQRLTRHIQYRQLGVDGADLLEALLNWNDPSHYEKLVEPWVREYVRTAGRRA